LLELSGWGDGGDIAHGLLSLSILFESLLFGPLWIDSIFLGCDQSDPFGPLHFRCRSDLPGRYFRIHRAGPVSVYEDSVVGTPFHVGDVAHMAASGFPTLLT
jgi:hypothetical protein